MTAPSPRPREGLLPLLVGLAALVLTQLLVRRLPGWDTLPPPGGRPPAWAGLLDDAPPPFPPLLLRSDRVALRLQFQAALEPYAAGDWKEACERLGRLLIDQPDHGPAHLYRGAARLARDALDGAAIDLAAVVAGPPGPLADHGRWLLAQVHLRRDEPAGAAALLRDLARRPGPFAPRARDLLAALGDPDAGAEGAR